MPDEKRKLNKLEAPESQIDHAQIEKKREIVEEEIEKVMRPEEQEQAAEKTVEATEKETLLKKEKLGEAGGIVALQAAQKRTEDREKKIEGILAVGLEEIYLNMPPDKQKEFKQAGEKTAKEINTLLQKTKVKAKKVIDLIKKWLLLIPGVNKYFLEQEAKIKADEIIEMKNELDNS